MSTKKFHGKGDKSHKSDDKKKALNVESLASAGIGAGVGVAASTVAGSFVKDNSETAFNETSEKANILEKESHGNDNDNNNVNTSKEIQEDKAGKADEQSTQEANPEPKPEPKPEPEPSNFEGEQISEEEIISESLFVPVGTSIVVNNDGERILAVVMEDNEGNKFYLADINGDGYFNEAIDGSGNLLADMDDLLPTNLTLGDIENLYDPEGGYVGNVADIEPIGEDPETDIVVTTNDSPHESQEEPMPIGSNEATHIAESAAEDLSDSVSDEELYAQIFGDETYEDSKVYDDDTDTETTYAEPIGEEYYSSGHDYADEQVDASDTDDILACDDSSSTIDESSDMSDFGGEMVDET